MSTTNNNDILREYAATANNPEYKGNWEVIDSKFPELKDYDKQVLREYAATANNPEYKGDWNVIDKKFPELFGSSNKPLTDMDKLRLGSFPVQAPTLNLEDKPAGQFYKPLPRQTSLYNPRLRENDMTGLTEEKTADTRPALQKEFIAPTGESIKQGHGAQAEASTQSAEYLANPQEQAKAQWELLQNTPQKYGTPRKDQFGNVSWDLTADDQEYMNSLFDQLPERQQVEEWKKNPEKWNDRPFIQQFRTVADSQKSIFGDNWVGDTSLAVGNVVEALNAGGAAVGGGLTEFIHQNIEKPLFGWVSKDPSSRLAFGRLADVFFEDQAYSSSAAGKHNTMDENGNIRQKDFTDYIKEGDFASALGDLSLGALESAPTSAVAIGATMAGSPQVGLSVIGAQVAGSRKRELDATHPGLSEFQKNLIAYGSGAIEAGSEMLGDIPIGKMLGKLYKTGGTAVAENVMRNSVDGIIKATTKQLKNGSILWKAPLMEGGEEFVSGVGNYLLDSANGLQQFNMSEMLSQSAKQMAYGAVAGGGFGLVGTPGLIRNAKVAKQLQTLKSQYDAANSNMQNAFADSEFEFEGEKIITLPLAQQQEILPAVYDAENLSDEQKTAIRDYMEAGNKLNAALVNVGLTNIELLRKKANAFKQVQESINDKTGKLDVITIQGTADTQQYNVKSGTVVLDNEGKVDTQNSDEAIYYYTGAMNEDGTPEVNIITPESISELTQLDPKEELKSRFTEIEAEEFVRSEFGEGMQIQVNTDAGLLPATVVAVTPTGLVANVQGQEVELSFTQAVEDVEAVEQPISPKEEQENQSPTYAPGTSVVVNGTTFVVGEKDEEGNYFINDENGQQIDRFTPEEMAEMGFSAAVTPTEAEQQPITLKEEYETAPVTPETTPVQQYPVNKKGEIDFDAMTVPQTYQYMVDNYGQQEAVEALQLQEKNTQAAIQVNIKATDKFKSGQYAEVKKATTIQEQLKIREKHKATAQKLADERAVLDAQLAEIRALMPQVEQAPAQPEVMAVKGSNVRPEEQFRREQEAKLRQNQQTPASEKTEDNVDAVDNIAETVVNEQQPVIEVREKEEWKGTPQWTRRLINLGDAMTVEDVVLRRIAGGAKFVWTASAPLKGLAEELGFTNKPGERKLRKNLIDNENGMTPQEFAHVIYESGDLDFMPGVEYQDVYNAVVETLLQVNSATMAMEKAEANRNKYDMMQEDYDIYRSITPEEWAYLEEIPDEILAAYLGITNFSPEQIDFIFNIQNEYYANEQQQTPVNAEPADTSTSERSESIESTTSTEQQTEQQTELTQAELDTQELDAYIAGQAHNSNPTEKQKETGIYNKARISLQGHNITLETLKGQQRSGTDSNGKAWSITMNNHYGELDGTTGYDGDAIDVFVGPNPKQGQIFVIDQVTPPPAGTPLEEGENPRFDESKVMLGFDTAEEAKAAYLSNYEEAWQGFGSITPAGDKFKQWLYDGKKQRKPFAEYKETPEAVEIADQFVDTNEMIEKPVEAKVELSDVDKYNGKTVYRKGLAYKIDVIPESERNNEPVIKYNKKEKSKYPAIRITGVGHDFNAVGWIDKQFKNEYLLEQPEAPKYNNGYTVTTEEVDVTNESVPELYRGKVIAVKSKSNLSESEIKEAVSKGYAKPLYLTDRTTETGWYSFQGKDGAIIINKSGDEIYFQAKDKRSGSDKIIANTIAHSFAIDDYASKIKPEINSTTQPIKNGDTVTYKGKQYIVNGIYAGNKEVDLEDEKGNLIHEEVPVSELNQSDKTAEKEVEDFSKFVIGEYELKNTVKRSPTPNFEEYQNEAVGRYIHLIKPYETITGRELATRIAKTYDLYNIANRVDFSAIWYMGNKEVKHTLNGVSVKGKHKGNVSTAEVKPENKKEYTGVKAQIQQILDNYEESVNMNMQEVIENIVTIAYDNDITEIQDAYKTYEDERREDREVWGERGDREAIENNFMQVVNDYLNQTEQPTEKQSSGNKLPEQAEVKNRIPVSEVKPTTDKVSAAQGKQPLSAEGQEIVDTDSKIQNIVEQPKITATDEKIEDVGQKIGGAKKDLFQEYAKKLLSVTDQDIARLPLSKSFPRPNFAQLIEDGKMTQETAIFLNYFYDNIPSKPQKSYKVERWVKTVREALDTFNSVLESKPTRDLMQEYIDMLNTNIVGQRKAFNAEVYRAVRKAINFPNNDVNVGNLTILRSQTGENAYVYSVGNPIGNRVKLTGRFNTMEEAAAKLIEMAKETAGKPKQVEFSVYSSRSSGDFYITPKGKGEIVLQNGFKTSKEAFEYINENREALTDRFNAMKEIPSERRMSNKERVGFDYRQGKNVTAEDFGNEFGFRGVEFGNWVNQEERQAHINEAYDALMDLASVIGVTPRALSLNGELGFAFGSRGGGKYAAHYETDKVVINLTKTKGAGTLAHEWFHALDNYLLRAVGNRTSYATDGPGFNKEGKPALRPELNDAFRNLMKVIRKSGFYTRSTKLDKVKGSKYWGTSVELGARGFEDFVMNKLAKSNIQNDYLVNFKSLAEFIDRVNGDISEITSKYPYPTMEESETISEAYQNLFDTIQEDDNGVLFQAVSPIGFYSTVEKALEAINQERGTRDQFRAMLLKNGAKQAEMDWMGFDELPEKLTKADIQNWIDENRIEVEEVEKSAIYAKQLSETRKIITQNQNRKNYLIKVSPELTEEIKNELLSISIENESLEEKARILEEKANIERDNKPKFSQYVLPGGENYKELLLTMPEKETFDTYREKLSKKYGEFSTKNDYSKEENEKLDLLFKNSNNKFKSSHFDEPNILAHIRFNERTVNGERVLFIEEIQSDWAQEGKKKGFAGKLIDTNLNYIDYRTQLWEKYNVESVEELTGKATQNEIDTLAYLWSKESNTTGTISNSVPDMPFRKTDQWVNLAARRMIRYAAENGFDRIAWTTGEQQADRYNLAKQVDRIVVDEDGGKYTVMARPLGKTDLEEITVATKENLSDYIGKELATKAINDGGGDFSGDDLKVGGSGMKAFYDAIVPSAMSKLGKPFGAKVERVDLGFDSTDKNPLKLKGRRYNPPYGQGVMDITRIPGYDYIEKGDYIILDESGNSIAFVKEQDAKSEQDAVEVWYSVLEGEGEYKRVNSGSEVQSIPVTDSMKQTAMAGMPLYHTGTTMQPATPEEVAATVEQLLKTGLAKEVRMVTPEEIAGILEGNEQLHAVYHGSPHSFDQFSLDHIGTGEGVQAYGWGLYFTDKKAIAEDYANMNKGSYGNNLPVIKNINRSLKDIGINEYDKYDLVDFANQLTMNRNFKETLGLLKRWASHDKSGLYTALYNDLDKLSEDVGNKLLGEGNLYSVELHEGKDPSEYDYLRWDKEITKEQLDKIESGLSKINPDYDWEVIGLDYMDMTNATGEEIYQALARYFEDFTDSPNESPKEASLFLLRAGIDGIKYPSNFTTGKSNETDFNYVVFDPRAITIKEKVQFMRTPTGTIYGFVKNGIVYINSNTPNLNTPIHEFGHLWVDAIEGSDLYNRGAELVKETPYWERVNADPNYSHLSENARAKEAMAMAIGDKGEAVKRNIGLFARIKVWIADVWTRIGSKFGIQNLTPEQIQNLTFNDFVDVAVSELMSGQPLTPKGEQETKLPNTIEVDGVQRPTTNSAGKPIHSTEEGIRNFWRWFGDSKVVDNEGRPLVVYHGTSNISYKKAEFDKFIVPAFFSNSPIEAEFYTNNRAKQGNNIMPVYLSIKNIIDFRNIPMNLNTSQTSINYIYDILSNNFKDNEIVDILNGASKIQKKLTGFSPIWTIKKLKIAVELSNLHKQNSLTEYFSKSKEVLKKYNVDDNSLLFKFKQLSQNEKIKRMSDVYAYSDKLMSDNKFLLEEINKFENKPDYRITQLMSDESVSSLEMQILLFSILDRIGGDTEFLKLCKKKQIDGTAFKDPTRKRLTKKQSNVPITYAVFNATQIKSATGNDGSFDPNEPDIRYQIIGERGAESLDAAEEATTRLDNLAVAKEMEATKTPQEIRLATGWERGVDGLWRYEIDDADIDLSGWKPLEYFENKYEYNGIVPSNKLIQAFLSNYTFEKEVSKRDIELWKNIIESGSIHGKELSEKEIEGAKIFFDHILPGDVIKSNKSMSKEKSTLVINDTLGNIISGEVLKAYPELKNIEVRLKVQSMGTSNYEYGLGVWGDYNDWGDNDYGKGIITLTSNAKAEKSSLEMANLYENKFKEALIHEIQHAIQKAEGFARGTSIQKSGTAGYRNSAGEVEARNASARMNFTADERRQRLLSETADVAPEDQIVLMDATGVSMNQPTKPEFTGDLGEFAQQTTEYNDQQAERTERISKMQRLQEIMVAKSALAARHRKGEVNNQEYAKQMLALHEERQRVMKGLPDPDPTDEGPDDSDPKPTRTIGQSIAEYATAVADWNYRQTIAKALDKTASSITGGLPPVDDDTDISGDMIRAELDQRLGGFFGRLAEGWQDNIRSVRIFLDLLREKGTKVSDFNNFYMQYTAIQGKNDAHLKDFGKRFMEAINANVLNIQKYTNYEYRDVENYVFLKHGIERNEYMRAQAAAEAVNEKLPPLTKEQIEGDIDGSLQDEYKAAYDQFMEEETAKVADKDYSGLFAVAAEIWAKQNGEAFNPKKKGDVARIQKMDEFKADRDAVIAEYIAEFEKTIADTIIPTNKKGEQLTIEGFWAAINAATNYSLDRLVSSGIESKEDVDDLKARYQYYVPLRGHEVEAEKIWQYEAPDNKNVVSKAIMQASGRGSRAEHPFAYIIQMAQTSINKANRNQLNQTILRLARLDKSGLMSVSETWYVLTGTDPDTGKEIWTETEPDFSEDHEIRVGEIRAWNEKMTKLEEEGKARRFRKGLRIGGLFIKPKQKRQHAITIFEDGISYQVYINGNPRVSQAINELNDKRTEIPIIPQLTRFCASMMTSRSPQFMLTNGARDLAFASSILPSKEGGRYTGQFLKNYPVAMAILANNATFDFGNDKAKYKKYLKEFEMNGGETGYTHLLELQDIQKDLYKKQKGKNYLNPKTDIDAIISIIDGGNKVIENSTRLATYITSRENGRSIERSVSDSKEVTLNFNRRGSGIMGASFVKSFFMFVNAGVQALANFGHVYKMHPAKMSATIGTYAAVGFLMPMIINMIGGDDDEKEYMNMTDWERQTNLCLPTGGGFAKIPLPQEMRIFFKLGDEVYKLYSGRTEASETAMATLLSAADMIPISPLGTVASGEINDFGDLQRAISPDGLRGVAELATNTNFMGGQIYDKYKAEKEGLPGYQKARLNRVGEPRAPESIVGFTRWLDHFTGGDGVNKGGISWNPDIVNHLAKSYFGGMYSLVAEGEKSFTKRFYTSNADIEEKNTTVRDYYKRIRDAEEVIRQDKGYQEQLEKGEISEEAYNRAIPASVIEKAYMLRDYGNEITKIERILKTGELTADDELYYKHMSDSLKQEVIRIK